MMRTIAILLLAGAAAIAQAPATSTAPKMASAAKAQAAATPPAPKTAEEFQQDLTTALHAAPYTDDDIHASVQNDAVTLTGTVHSAERKGLATRLVRSLATKDGWHETHVYNRLDVQPKT